jgi:hypothetical protein
VKSISLSIDPDTQEETTAPVVIPVEAADRPAAPSKGAPSRLPKSAKIGLRALQKALNEEAADRPADVSVTWPRNPVRLRDRGYSH